MKGNAMRLVKRFLGLSTELNNRPASEIIRALHQLFADINTLEGEELISAFQAIRAITLRQDQRSHSRILPLLDAIRVRMVYIDLESKSTRMMMIYRAITGANYRDPLI